MKNWRFAKSRVTVLGLVFLCAALGLTVLLVPVGNAMWYGELVIVGEITLQDPTPSPSPTVSNSLEVVPEGGVHQGKKVRLEPIVNVPVPTEVPGSLAPKPVGGAGTPAVNQPGASEPAGTPVPTVLPAPTSLPPKTAK